MRMQKMDGAAKFSDGLEKWTTRQCRRGSGGSKFSEGMEGWRTRECRRGTGREDQIFQKGKP